MRYVITKDGMIDVKSVEERLLNEIKDLVKQEIYDLDDDDEDGEKRIEAELNSIKVTSTMEAGKIVISCESDTQDLCEEFDVIKTSDDIKELLDTYSVVGRDGKCYPFFSLECAKKSASLFHPAGTIYGCIHITLPNRAVRIEPVAKMNKKGDFEPYGI